MSDLTVLVQTAQQGNHQAFGQIVHRFQDMAFAYAYSIVGDSGLAQDAAQEAFMDAYQSMATLREPAAFPGWFRRIVLKHSDRQIRGKRAAMVALDEAGPLRSPQPDPETLMDEALFRGDVHAAIALLPPNQRSVTTLFYVEGYSYDEIAAFLEIPISAVKKRLFNARKNLKERMVDMVQEKLQAGKPSQDEKFANQVLFFSAVLDDDTDAVRRLVQSDATLLDAAAEWKMAIKREYSIGSTALDLAVARGYKNMTDLLLGLGADANASNKSQMTPLHTAALNNRSEIAAVLIGSGAEVDAKSYNKQTPLHIAAMRNNRTFVDLLLAHGANVNAKEQNDRTPADWATLTGNAAVVDLLVAAGAKKPKSAVVEAPVLQRGTIFESGIKIIDLLAPLKRGGVNAIFTPMSGVGKMVVACQLMRNVQKVHGGSVILAGLHSNHSHQDAWEQHLQEIDSSSGLTYLFENQTDDPNQPLAVIDKAMDAAGEVAADGREVLVVLSSKLFESTATMEMLRGRLGEMTSVTVLVYGEHTVGVLPAALASLDSVITFSRSRAQAHLYPAIDPVRSTSALFENELSGSTHAGVADAARRMMTRYDELRYGYDKGGPDTLWYIDDDPMLEETLVRARRLDRFFTQPFSGVEPWTGTLGEFVLLPDTVRGSEEILAGRFDDVDEAELMYKGAV